MTDRLLAAIDAVTKEYDSSPRRDSTIHTPRIIRAPQRFESPLLGSPRVSKPGKRNSLAKGSPVAQKRIFTCSFARYGCKSTFSSKNEWKRHMASQHLQLGFYRCDTGLCNPETHSKPSNRSYNDFNRKDLFTQHHRRMHKPWSGPKEPSAEDKAAFEASLEEVRRRCWREKRKPPRKSLCGFCGEHFEGEHSWDERMEHVGKHYEKSDHGDEVEGEDANLLAWGLEEEVIKDCGKKGFWLEGLDPPRSSISANGDISRGEEKKPQPPEETRVSETASSPPPEAIIKDSDVASVQTPKAVDVPDRAATQETSAADPHDASSLVEISIVRKMASPLSLPEKSWSILRELRPKIFGRSPSDTQKSAEESIDAAADHQLQDSLRLAAASPGPSPSRGFTSINAG